MKPNEIKQAIYDKGYDLTMVAEALGKSSSLISKVIHSKARSLVVAEAIAKILDKDINYLFPNQYYQFRGLIKKDSDAYRVKLEELKKILK